MSQLGRISGPLLTSNLVRNGANLTFRDAALDPDLLFLDVTNKRVGINVVPDNALDVSGTSRITNGIVTGTSASFDNLIFNTSGTVSSTVGPIIIAPTGDGYVEYGAVSNPSLSLKDNYIRVTATDTNLTFNPSGSGIVDIQSETDITGNLGVTGNILATGNTRVDGQFIVGDSPLDTVTIVPDFTQSIIPGDDGLYDLGKIDKRWDAIFVHGLSDAGLITTTNATISDQLRLSGQTISSLQSNDDIVFSSDSGNVTIENLNINQNIITHTVSSALTLSHTGRGYLRLTDNNALAIPSGDNSDRPGIEVAETRWNTELGYLECFDGTVWQVATGGGIVVTAPIMEELGQIYTLIFG